MDIENIGSVFLTPKTVTMIFLVVQVLYSLFFHISLLESPVVSLLEMEVEEMAITTDCYFEIRVSSEDLGIYNENLLGFYV